jgi:penicillin-binding protein 2
LASRGFRATPDRFLPPDPRVEEPYRLTPQMALRVAILGVIALGLFAVLFTRLWALQVLSGPRYATVAENNRQRIVPLTAPRGPILDRNGRILVTNVPSTAVLLWPGDLLKGDGRDTELRRLAAVLNVPLARIVEQIKARRGDLLTPITVQVAIHPDQVAYLKEHASEFPGVVVSDSHLRRYKSEALATHVLGYVGEISPDRLHEVRKQGLACTATLIAERKQCYRASDSVGLAGIESTYDRYLFGTPGTQTLLVDSLGRKLGELRDGTMPVAGLALRLTIDISLQRAAERALRYGIELARRDEHWAANGGAIIAMDPKDGAILAMASNPTYRPSVWVGKPDPKQLAPLLDAKAAKEANYPGLNRVTAGLYPAGSTFKPVTALAALETPNLISPYQTLPCTPDYEASGQIFKNWDPYVNEQMDMPTAIAASCDTYFYQLGFRFYGLPPNAGHPLQDWASRFGFGGLTGIDLGPEQAGLLPTPGWRQKTYTKQTDPCCWEIDRLWKPGDSIQLAIGQKDLLVTPLQMARFYALVANGGSLVTPHLALDAEQPRSDESPGKVEARFIPSAPRATNVDPGSLEAVRKGLYEATHAEYGTATGVFGSFPVAIAGKTGTAEKVVDLPGYKGLMDQSWFCGYGPVEDPRIVVCALIENGGHGGTAAAPAARKVFEQFFGVHGGDVSDVYSD